MFLILQVNLFMKEQMLLLVMLKAVKIWLKFMNAMVFLTKWE